MPAHVEVMAQVDALAGRFLERTRGDIDRLRYLAKRAHGDGRTEFSQIERIAHSIHGAGAMFGFPAVSTLAGAIKHLAKSLLMDPVPATEPLEPAMLRLGRLIDQISLALAAAHAAALASSSSKSGTAFSRVRTTDKLI